MSVWGVKVRGLVFSAQRISQAASDCATFAVWLAIRMKASV